MFLEGKSATDRMDYIQRWPHVTPEIAQRACDEYRAQYGNYDPNLLECSGWWLWKRTRELANDSA
jgi:hypothetical protein